MEDKTIYKQVNQCYCGCADQPNRGILKDFIRIVGELAGIAGLIFDIINSNGTRERVEIAGQVTVVSYDSDTVIAIEDIVVVLNPGYACQITYYSDGTAMINIYIAENE